MHAHLLHIPPLFLNILILLIHSLCNPATSVQVLAAGPGSYTSNKHIN